MGNSDGVLNIYIACKSVIYFCDQNILACSSSVQLEFYLSIYLIFS